MNEGHSHLLPSQRGLENRTTTNTRLITATRLPAICGVSLASDTVIPTPDGWTTLADIRPGERVFDERGRTLHCYTSLSRNSGIRCLSRDLLTTAPTS